MTGGRWPVVDGNLMPPVSTAYVQCAGVVRTGLPSAYLQRGMVNIVASTVPRVPILA